MLVAARAVDNAPASVELVQLARPEGRGDLCVEAPSSQSSDNGGLASLSSVLYIWGLYPFVLFAPDICNLRRMSMRHKHIRW